MNKHLKKAIVNFIFENEKEFQLSNAAMTKFRAYIYTCTGDYLIGGENVRNFIRTAIDLVD